MKYRLQHHLFDSGYTIEARTLDSDRSGFVPFAEISGRQAFRGVGKHRILWMEARPNETLEAFAERLVSAWLLERPKAQSTSQEQDTLSLF